MRITPGPLAHSMSGKLGNHIVQERDGTLYIRKSFTPANPRSADQNLQRNAQTICLKHFQQTSYEVSDTWTASVKNRPLLAHNYFLKLNTKAQRYGDWLALTPPSPYVPPFTAFTLESKTHNSITCAITRNFVETTVADYYYREQFTTPHEALITPDQILPLIHSGFSVGPLPTYTFIDLSPETTYILYCSQAGYRYFPWRPYHWNHGLTLSLTVTTDPAP